MATSKPVWGIDIGQCALKAIKLRNVNGQLQVEAFDVIEYPQILCEEGVDDKQLIHAALEQFLSRNSVSGCEVAIAVPGRSSFSRFVKLPPVESKKIPDIVRFEAEQQIPFAIEEVIWRWQTFHDPDSPDVEVGLFAMKRVDINKVLDHFRDASLDVDVVQVAPLALYNFMICDEQAAPQGATILVDVGTDKTDLVVSDGARIWTRTIQVGGKNFTEALERAFKLSFSKAEKLKRGASTNKYARQVFQAMRPVFADLVQEIQRSIGYYTSLHREARFKRLVAIGNGFRLPGLQKFLEQNLSIPVVRVDTYTQLTMSSAVNASAFAENVLSFAVAYGLALQGLGEAPVHTNLLPEEIAKKRCWDKKRIWFAVAAAVLVLAMAGYPYRSWMDRKILADSGRMEQLSQARQIQQERKKMKTEDQKYGNKDELERQKMYWFRNLYGYRNFWPSVQDMISTSVKRVATDQHKLTATTDEELQRLRNIKRDRRKIIIIEKWTAQELTPSQVVDEIATASGEGEESRTARMGRPGRSPKSKAKKINVNRGFKLSIEARTPLRREEVMRRLISPLIDESLRIAADTIDGAKPFKIIVQPRPKILAAGEKSGAAAPGRAAGRLPGIYRPGGGMEEMGGRGRIGAAGKVDGVKLPDPLLPEEDMSNDTRFTIEWIITVESDGLKRPENTK